MTNSLLISSTNNLSTNRQNIMIKFSWRSMPSTKRLKISKRWIIVGDLGIPEKSLTCSPVTFAQEIVVIFLIGDYAYIESIFLEFDSIFLQFCTILYLISCFPLAHILITPIISIKPDPIHQILRHLLHKNLQLLRQPQTLTRHKSKIGPQPRRSNIRQRCSNIGINARTGGILAPCCILVATSEDALHQGHAGDPLAHEDSEVAGAEGYQGEKGYGEDIGFHFLG